MTDENRASAPLTPKDRAERTDARLKVAAAVLGLLTALFGLVAGVFVKKNDTATTKVDTTQQQVQALASENVTLKNDNAKKDATIKQLQDAVTVSAGPSPGAEPSPGSDTPPVFHQGTVTLKPGVGADLDASVDNPQWHTDGSAFTHNDVMFSNTASALVTETNRSTAMDTQESPTYATCRNATGYSDATYSLAKLRMTRTFCVITSEDRYSVLQIKSAANSEVSLSVTTYAKD